MNESIRSYLDNRRNLVQVRHDNNKDQQRDHQDIVGDIYVTMCIDLVNRGTPIALALDGMQRTSITISVVLEIWSRLEINLIYWP